MRQPTLGSVIRSLRKQHGLTQAALAGRLNVTDKAVSKWERGLSYPDIALFPKLADIFGVTVEDLMEEYIDGEKPSRLIRILEMSHDVLTPLHIIIGCANMAVLYHEDESRLIRYLENIRISGEYLKKAIYCLMAVADPKKCEGDAAKSAFLSDAVKSGGFSKKPEGALDLGEKRILVAEDMEINREIAHELLKETGAKTDFAFDGKECAQKIKEAPKGHYDLILMDIKMPVMDGIEATKEIRAMADTDKAGIPIIAMTANVSIKDRNAAFAAGMNGFIKKPVDSAELFSEIGRLI